jgi:hypothetical protein
VKACNALGEFIRRVFCFRLWAFRFGRRGGWFGDRGQRLIERCLFGVHEELLHSTGVRGSRAEGREGIQCKFSAGREGAIEESEVVIWVCGVLLNAASDFREGYFHWRTCLSMRTIPNFSPINRLPKETTHGQIPTTATAA